MELRCLWDHPALTLATALFDTQTKSDKNLVIELCASRWSKFNVFTARFIIGINIGFSMNSFGHLCMNLKKEEDIPVSTKLVFELKFSKLTSERDGKNRLSCPDVFEVRPYCRHFCSFASNTRMLHQWTPFQKYRNEVETIERFRKKSTKNENFVITCIIWMRPDLKSGSEPNMSTIILPKYK